MKEASDPTPPPSFQLGGQALIEGVMMRSPHYVAAAVRRPDGSIQTHVEMFTSILKRHRWLSIPFFRGVVALFEMLALGMRFLNWSSNIALQDSQPQSKAQSDTQSNQSPISEPAASTASTIQPAQTSPQTPASRATVGGDLLQLNGHLYAPREPQPANHIGSTGTTSLETATSSRVPVSAASQSDTTQGIEAAVPVSVESKDLSPGFSTASSQNPSAAPVAIGSSSGSTPALDDPSTLEPESATQGLPLWVFLLTVAGSLGLGLLLFVALPNLIADWTLKRVTNDVVALNLFEGAVKLLIFIGYVWIIGLRPDIRRVFEYHGAEHKVVYAAENHRPLTPDGARPFDTPHPRCGTGFALLTVFVSILCFTFLPWTESHLTRVAMRFALMPVVAGISYEIIKLTTHPRWSALAQWIMTPGLWLQRLTTRQPDDEQLEVACAAMRVLLDAEKGEPTARPGLV